MQFENLILELYNRIVKLEKEVEVLKSKLSAPQEIVPQVAATQEKATVAVTPTRDKTKYMLDGVVYLKNRLVFAVVKDYVEKHASITCAELKQVFSKSLQGSIGVVEEVSVARLRNDYDLRFFSKADEILHLVDGDMVVCSQWGILNIANFVKRAEQLQYEIQLIPSEK